MEKICIMENEKNVTRKNDEISIAIDKVIENWPNWKKEEYNLNFAVSDYSDKLVISK